MTCRRRILERTRDRVGERYAEGPPDLVVEVSSPSTRRQDLVRKRRVYERFEVPEYWFVDLDADRVEVYVLRTGRYGAPVVCERGEVLRSTILEGLEIGVEDVVAAWPSGLSAPTTDP